MRLRTPADFGAAIREQRRVLDLDQAALARRVGVSRQWIIEVEKGKRGQPGKWGLAVASEGHSQESSEEQTMRCRCGDVAVGYNSTGQPVCAEHMAA